MMPCAAYRPLRLGSVLPDGWLKKELQKQANGFSGHQLEFCFPFDRKYWSGNEKGQVDDSRNKGVWWYPWEQMGYWTDGSYRCARLLGDRRLQDLALAPIRYSLENRIESWFIGSRMLFNNSGRNPGRWPQAVFFRALAAAAEGEQDPAITEAMRTHYLHDTVDYQGGAFGSRERIHIESLLWCYANSGDRALLDKAVKIWKSVPQKDLDALTRDTPSNMHGVTFAELSKLAALIFLYTGDQEALRVAVAMKDRVEKHHQLADGIPSTTENLGGTSALAGHETCDVVEFIWSWGYVGMATGSGEYGDLVERALFNAGMGSLKKDGKGIQYISCPNQVLVDQHSCAAGYVGTAASMYGPNSDHRPTWMFVTSCCAGNITRLLPTYVERMWMETRAGGLAAIQYGPCHVHTAVGSEGTPVDITEDTAYPFSDRIVFSVHSAKPVAFPLSLRIPAWCQEPSLEVNGQPVAMPALKQGFVTLTRTFSANDTVSLRLPMPMAMRKISGGTVVERGPLVYSLRIKEQWTPTVEPDFEITSPEFPMWAAEPGSPWNMALAFNSGKPMADQVSVVTGTGNAEDPWQFPTISLRVPAREVPGWTLRRLSPTLTSSRATGSGIKTVMEREKVTVDCLSTPSLPTPVMLEQAKNTPTQEVELVPLGSTHLRLTIFPQLP